MSRNEEDSIVQGCVPHRCKDTVKWHNWLLLLVRWRFANQLGADRHVPYWTVYYISKLAQTQNDITDVKADQQRRRVMGAIVPRVEGLLEMLFLSNSYRVSQSFATESQSPRMIRSRCTVRSSSHDMSAHTVRVKKALQLLLCGLAVKSVKIHLKAQRFTSSNANKAEVCASLFAKTLEKKYGLADGLEDVDSVSCPFCTELEVS